jgi:hypothetical protein
MTMTQVAATPQRQSHFLPVAVVVGLTALTLSIFNQRDINNLRDNFEPLRKSVVGLLATLAAKSAPPAPTSSATSVAQQALKDQLTLTTSWWGEGVEHALIRQMRADPKKYGFDGDVANQAAVAKWVRNQVQIWATDAGYVDWKFGAEIRVRHPGEVAFLLRRAADGRWYIDEYKAVAPGQGFGDSPKSVNSRIIAPSIAQSQFLGWPDMVKKHPLPSYEYRWPVPVEK